jgi:hypothetical protein
MGVLARRKSPQTSNAFSARGCMDLGRVVGEAVVRLRAERDVKRRARRWVMCILALLYVIFFCFFRFVIFGCSQEDGSYQDVRKKGTW